MAKLNEWILIFLFGLLLNLVVVESAEVIVEVEEGSISGEEKTFITGNGIYYSFMSIPYAEPPVGSLRFRDPIPIAPWEETINATSQPPDCPQAKEFEQYETSENCLYLNVYTPTNETENLLPVMFFIHGGGMYFGTGNFYRLGPDFLVDKDVILVTFNYRLGALGFLSLEIPEVPGNAGLKDQVTAFRWVKRNIARFGGDPDNITVFGHSSGAWSVGQFLISPMTRNLFKRAILLSGHGLDDHLNSIAPVDRAVQLGIRLGSNTKDPKETLDYLQSVPVNDIVNTRSIILPLENIRISPNFLRNLEFSPVVEKDFGQERFLSASIFELLKGNISQTEIIIGHTDIESLFVAQDYDKYINVYNTFRQFLLPFTVYIHKTQYEVLELAKFVYDNYFGNAPKISNNTIKGLSSFISDIFLNNNWQRFVRRMPRSMTVYVYLFSCISERNLYLVDGEKYGLIGAGHEDDLNYLFNPYYRNLTLDTESTSYKMIEQITTLYTNFAKFGKPTPDESLGVTWIPYDDENGTYLNINETLTLGTQFDEDLRSFWQFFYEYAGFEY